MQVAALLPGAKLKMSHFGERYCQGGTKWDKFAGGSALGRKVQHLMHGILHSKLAQAVTPAVIVMRFWLAAPT
jgi:hypothetical protein